MEHIGNHKRVWEYDGAYRCMLCKAQWGALPGHPTMPEQCISATLQDVNPPSLEVEALALLRELNDALVLPGWLQPRVDAVLDRAEEK